MLPVIITLSLYVVFFEKIASKPGSAGFWLIFAMGISFGVTFMRVFFGKTSNKTE